MTLLREVLKNIRRLDDEEGKDQPTSDQLDINDDESDSDELDGMSLDDLDSESDDLELDDSRSDNPDEMGLDDLEADGSDELDLDDSESDEDKLDDVVSKAAENPDRQGLIRTVKGAHLVYKREAEDGTYEEMWMFNTSDLKSSMEQRKAILAGTDIPVNALKSPDGSQEFSVWTAGNAEMIKIVGLPS